MGLIFCAVPTHFSQFSNLNHDNKSGILRDVFPPFLAKEDVLDFQDHPCQLHTAATVPQVVLAVGMDTSGAVLTSIDNLEAALEVANTNSF